jgi:hypothetical protein
MFKDGRANIYDGERNGWPSVINLVQVSIKKLVKDRFTISELRRVFPQISRTILYQTITVRLDYHKFCAR